MKTARPSEFLNISINSLAMGVFVLCLYGASRVEQLLPLVGIAVVFAYVGNTIFAFLHEAVHRVYATSAWLNEAGGILNGALFPTGLTFQRICHLGHHLRNRTDHEMFDMYYPDDNLFLKRAQFYSILTGVYWITIPLGWLTYLFLPWSYRLLKSENKAIKHTGAIMLHPFIDHPKKWRIRAELLFVIGVQASLFYFLELKFWPTFFCYWVFGLIWGSLQYADHAWSPRDVLRGAWNLKTNPVTRAFFLNYHYHQVHHMNPKLPWNHLPKHVDPTAPMPSFWKVYLEMWKGPRPVDAPSPAPIQEVEDALADEDLVLSKPLTAEWDCFVEFCRMTLRHRRYGFIGLILYGLSVRDFALAQKLRHGFCALQRLDDLLDGDLKSPVEPLLLSEAILAKTHTQRWDPHARLDRLFRAFLSQVDALASAAEIRTLVKDVIEAMQEDRRRVLERLTLSEAQWREQHRRTFAPSLDIVLALLGSNIRTRHWPELLDLFGWASTVRDLREDIEKGLVNIPREVLQGLDDPERFTVHHPRIEEWILAQATKQAMALPLIREAIESRGDDPGAKLLRIFVRSMERYTLASPVP